jgi:uncharacterized protein (TIGR00369 family)
MTTESAPIRLADAARVATGSAFDFTDLFAATRQVIAISPFARWMGTEVADVTPGRVVLRVPLRPEHRQHHGSAHGAVLGYMADTACSWAAATVVGDVVTSEFKIHLLAPARGSTLEAVGEVVRVGRRQVVARADVYTLATQGGREHVATALATIAVLGQPAHGVDA